MSATSVAPFTGLEGEAPGAALDDPRAAVEALLRAPLLPAGAGDRAVGFGVLGLPFASGDVLAVLRTVQSSTTPSHTSVWHRKPSGTWRCYTDVDADMSSARLGSADASPVVTTSMTVQWTARGTLRVTVPAAAIAWTMQLAGSRLTRILADVRGTEPRPVRYSRGALRLLGWGARIALGTGRLALSGRTPAGPEVSLHPQGMWLVTDASATIGGRDAGRPRPLPAQARLGELWIPQRGVFLIAAATVQAAAR